MNRQAQGTSVKARSTFELGSEMEHGIKEIALRKGRSRKLTEVSMFVKKGVESEEPTTKPLCNCVWTLCVKVDLKRASKLPS